jgi:hypothetical protein
MIVEISKKPYHISCDEFNKKVHHEYNHLIILDKLGYFDRIQELLKDLVECLKVSNLIIEEPTHGGYVLIKCSPYFQNIYVSQLTEPHLENINKNINIHETKNLVWLDKLQPIVPNTIYYTENVNSIDYKYIQTNKPPVLLIPYSFDMIKFQPLLIDYKMWNLSNTNMVLLVANEIVNLFMGDFRYYIHPEKPYELNYDNLIELCIMVKNGGEQFEETLKEALPYIDRWTILDTGSTDQTIEIINRVLSCKKGTLYREPFINFRDSRNRCLDLAGMRCNYTIMLDDTYRIKGNIRHFLQTVRGDQFSDSFSLYIQSDDVQYATNRILNTERKLRYKYKIHEVIQKENNMNVIIPNNVANIYDYRCDYMLDRTMERKQYDLKLLFEELEEDPDNPRTYYYIAQTYNVMGNAEMSYEYYLKRAYHPVEGFIQEKIDATFEAARTANFKLNRPWEECEKLYMMAYELDKSRPESMYFIGIHHYLSKNMGLAFEYLKEGYRIGYPIHCQYSLKPTLSFYFLPNFLIELCMVFENYELGKEVCEFFLLHNEKTVDIYTKIEDLYKTFLLKIEDKQSAMIPVPPVQEKKLSNENIMFYMNK